MLAVVVCCVYVYAFATQAKLLPPTTLAEITDTDTDESLPIERRISLISHISII